MITLPFLSRTGTTGRPRSRPCFTPKRSRSLPQPPAPPAPADSRFASAESQTGRRRATAVRKALSFDRRSTAERRLRAVASEEPANADHLGQALADAATAAIASGHPIAVVADAEQRGQQRARAALSRELLTRVQRAARRRREADHDLHQAIARGARLGLAHRDIAAAAHVAHGTIRAVLTRANGDTTPAPPEPEETPPTSHGTDTPLPS